MDDLISRCAWAISIIPKDEALGKGITDVELAKLLGTDKNTLARYRRKEGLLKGEVIDNLVQHYGFNPMWLFKGQGEPFPGARAKYPDVCGPERHPITENFALIPQVAGVISAGNGVMPDNAIDMLVAFRKDWIARKGTKPDHLSLIKVEGDSMEPTICSGDLVLVDHSRKTINPQGGIYALVIDDEIVIKRLQRLPLNRARIVSDNPQYPPVETALDNIMINGRVIWLGRDINI